MLQTYKRQVVISISIFVVLATVITAGVISSSHQATRQTSALARQESAYVNILKDSLNVYHSRYGTYPGTYQTLLDDINKSRDIYGVNSEGMSELTNVGARLGKFAYLSKSGGRAYEFTYDKASGSKITVRSE